MSAHLRPLTTQVSERNERAIKMALEATGNGLGINGYSPFLNLASYDYANKQVTSCAIL